MNLNKAIYVVTCGLSVGINHLADAQSVTECSKSGQQIIALEPYSENTKSYANGKTKITLVDTEADRAWLMLQVTSPPLQQSGAPTCQLISFDDYIGFEQVLMADLVALYDPAVGLMFDIPVITPEVSNKWTRLQFDLNQATGKLDAMFVGFVGVN